MSKPINPEKLQEEFTEFFRSKYGSDAPVPEMDLGAPHDGVSTSPDVPEETIDFDLKPTELEAFLKRYVVHQDEAIEIHDSGQRHPLVLSKSERPDCKVQSLLRRYNVAVFNRIYFSYHIGRYYRHNIRYFNVGRYCLGR